MEKYKKRILKYISKTYTDELKSNQYSIIISALDGFCPTRRIGYDRIYDIKITSLREDELGAQYI